MQKTKHTQVSAQAQVADVPVRGANLVLVFQRFKSYAQLMKLRLSSLVVISALFGYLMAPMVAGFDVGILILLGLGGFLVTGAANALNQVIEVDLDKKMQRTAARPLPSGRITSLEAIVVALLAGAAGIAILAWAFNLTAALLGIISLLLYAFVYTPLKRIHPVAVLVGAIPGAMPPMIGWAAATGGLETGAWILFLFQFLWQFPHFWAIAWILNQDYLRAGFKMLPHASGKSKLTAKIILLYTVLLVPVCFFPWRIEMTEGLPLLALVIAGFGYSALSILLLRNLNNKSAKWLMFGSFLYLPLMQAAMLIGKFY